VREWAVGRWPWAAWVRLDVPIPTAAIPPRPSALCSLSPPQVVHEPDDGGGGGQEGHQAPNGAGCGQEPQRGFGHDAEGAFGADEEIDEVHVGIDEVAGRVFARRAAQGRERAGDGAEGETQALGPIAAAAEVEDFAGSQGDAQAEHVVAGGAVQEREGAGRVAGDHAADGGGGLGGVGGEIEMRRDGGADGGERGAGLDDEGFARDLDPVHVGQIEDESTFGHGPAGHAGAGALGRDGSMRGAGFGEGRADVGFGAGESDAVGAADAAGFVAQVVRVGRLERFTHGGQYSLLRVWSHG